MPHRVVKRKSAPPSISNSSGDQDLRKKWNLLPLDLLKKVVLHHDLQPGRTKKELINSLISESIPVLSVAQATSLTTPPSDPSDDSSPDDDLKYPDPDREDIGSGVPLTRDDVAKMIEDTVARFRESDAPRRNCCPSCQSPRTDGQRFCGDFFFFFFFENLYALPSGQRPQPCRTIR